MFIRETDDEYPIGSNYVSLFIGGLVFRIFYVLLTFVSRVIGISIVEINY